MIFSGKGGIGKTTVAVNLAYAHLENNYIVGLLYADITGPIVLADKECKPIQVFMDISKSIINLMLKESVYNVK